MDIFLVNLESSCLNFVSTCLFKGILKEAQFSNFYVYTTPENINIYKYNKNVKLVSSDITDFYDLHFDLLLNLSPEYHNTVIKTREIIGFNYTDIYQDYYDMIYGDKKTKSNIYQIYYNLLGLKWKGEGLFLQYYPKSKEKIKKTGISISNSNLRCYILDKLNLEESKTYCIPFKKNIFRKADQINQCNQIVTDDFYTLQIALWLKKYVFFLKTINYNYKIEYFGTGQEINIPNNILQTL